MHACHTPLSEVYICKNRCQLQSVQIDIHTNDIKLASYV